MNIFNRKPKKPDPFPYKLSRELHEDWRDFAWEKMAVPTMAKAIVPTVPTEPLVALHCSSCGAPFSPTTRRCEYCGTWFGPQPSKPELYGQPVGYDKAMKGLTNSAKKMQASLDASAIADLMRASEKFKTLGLLSG